MAFTYEYKRNTALSKAKIGETVYYLKDLEARAALLAEINKLGTAAYRNWSDVVSDDENLVSGKAVVDYLKDTMSEVAKALVFQGVSSTDPLTEGATINGTLLTPTIGDVVLYGIKEYIYDGAQWIELGDEGIYLTKNDAAATYVAKVIKVAGIDLADDITVEELIAALDIKALAHKDSASGTIQTIDSLTIADHTPAGEVGVVLDYASTTMSAAGTYTPAGKVSGKNTSAGSVALARNDEGFQISGTVSAPALTITPATTEVQHLTSVGALPTYTAAAYTAPSVNESTSKFANEGIIIDIDEEDAEMLVFSAATKGDALTATGFNAGSYTAAQFNAGALPVLGEAQTVMTGIAKAEAAAPVFTGDKIAATFTGSETEIAATFAGTEGNISVSGNYDKANVKETSFTGAKSALEVEISRSAKTITVQ